MRTPRGFETRLGPRWLVLVPYRKVRGDTHVHVKMETMPRTDMATRSLLTERRHLQEDKRAGVNKSC